MKALDDGISQCRTLALRSCQQLHIVEKALQLESAKLLVSGYTLDDAINRLSEKRRKQPWRYLACTSRLLVLQAERDAVLDSLQSIKKRLNNLQTEQLQYLRQYARLSCRQLCTVIMKRLPRELRDLIYNFLLPRTTVDAKTQWDQSYVYLSIALGMKMNTCDYYWQLQYGTRPLPEHCVDKYHMGRMLRELAYTWDRITKFRVRIQDIPQLLRSEHWLDGRRAGTVIRNLAVTVIYPKHLRYDWDTMMPHNYVNSILEYCPIVNLCLEHLLGLKPGARVSVLLEMSDSRVIARHPCNLAIREMALLNCIVPMIGTLRKLQDYGLLIEVTLTDYGCRLSGADHPVSEALWKSNLEAHNDMEDRLFA